MRWIRHPGRALDAYIDGELGAPDTDRVVAHLERCRVCRRRVALTLRIRRSLAALAGRA